MEVLEDEHERASRRDRFEEPPPRGERFGAVVAAQLVGGS